MRRRAASLLVTFFVLLPICSQAGERPDRVDPALLEIAAAQFRVGTAAALRRASERGVRITERNGEIFVTAIVAAEEGRLPPQDEEIENVGAEVLARSQAYVRVLVPAGLVGRLASLEGVGKVRRPYMMKSHALGSGTSVSESVTLVQADIFQTRGFRGQDVGVAVVDLGFIGLSEAISLGELPSYTVAVKLPGQEQTIERYTKHGTGVAEQVADIAPAAHIYCIMIEDELDLQNAMAYIRQQGIRVGIHSVGWVNTSYYDDTGPINDLFNSSRQNDGVFWAVAAGNDANRHWRGTWAGAGSYLEFVPGVQQMRVLGSAGQASIFLNWNQYSSTSPTDLDLHIFDKNGTLVTSSTSRQSRFVKPQESVWFNLEGSRAPYYVGVQLHKGSVADIDMTIFSFNHDLEFAVAESSLMDPANASGAYSVAAINQGNWLEADPVPASYSSRGPTNDGRQKPDITAPDGTTSWSYGTKGSYGTSFSAPVLGGAAALLINLDPSISSGDIWREISNAARETSEPGWDNIFGYGRLSLESIASLGNAIYVCQNASGFADGASWQTAFNHPQQAADVALPGNEIWIATGTYGVPDGSVSVLVMTQDVAVYGGFAGIEIFEMDRDPVNNPTIFEGGTEARTVMANSGSTLDGITLKGAGMLIDGVTSFTASRCRFEHNTSSSSGGGVRVSGSFGVDFSDCVFLGNDATNGGGAYVSESSVTFVRCRFDGNTAAAAGGGLHASASSVVVRESIFLRNSASEGGGVAGSDSGSIELGNCIMAGNRAGLGAAVSARGATDVVLRHCTVTGNRADTAAGGIFIENGASATAANTILWQNLPEETAGVISAIYSIVRGGADGLGIIDADPLFVLSGQWDENTWIGGDYMLRSGSPCIDAADGEWSYPHDFSGLPRVEDPLTPITGVGEPPYADIGAHEYHRQESSPKRRRGCAGTGTGSDRMPSPLAIVSVIAAFAGHLPRLLWRCEAGGF